MIPWTVTLQTPLTMGFSRQEYWSGLSCLPPGAFPNSEIKLASWSKWGLVVPGHFSRIWLCSLMDCSPPGSSVHGILQARILEWVAIFSSRGSSWARDQTRVSSVSWLVRQFLYPCVSWKAFFCKSKYYFFNQENLIYWVIKVYE